MVNVWGGECLGGERLTIEKNMPVLVYNFVCGTGGKESESDFLPILERALLVPETKI